MPAHGGVVHVLCAPPETALVFFGRSSLHPEAAAPLARRLTARLGLAARRLGWGHPPAFWPMGERHRFEFARPGLGRASAPVIITETYHLCVNAWRVGVPAVCLMGEQPDTWSVNSGSPGTRRDKPTELFNQLDVTPLLATAESLRGTLRQPDRIAEAVSDPLLTALAADRVAKVKISAATLLRQALAGSSP